MLKHVTVIWTGTTCKKMFCYMRESACRWLIVENAKIFWSYVKHFWIFPLERNCRIVIGLCKYSFMNHLIMFFGWDNKASLVVFLRTLKKITFSSKNVMWNLHIIKKLIKLFYLYRSCKSTWKTELGEFKIDQKCFLN